MKEKLLEEEIGDLLQKHKLKIGVAESATGGLISHRITNIPSSSEYFEGSIISYSNKAKTNLLAVKESTLRNYGAVSSETSKEMAQGVRREIGTDIGLASTGIAGPGGGTSEKPVGLVYIGLAIKGALISKKYVFHGNRDENKKSFSDAALSTLEKYLLKL
ncbi:MAG: CinA family protein [Candidatus Bathyarchaeota archaeon]|nr:CinA family protein [Candidatus Bathyarchaeota archaeon]MDH5596165.1 CinA family protein [Candidatus Bathyarchaeota archaeon]